MPEARPLKSQVPDFVVDDDAAASTDLFTLSMVTCHRCKQSFYLKSTSPWFDAHGETRPCPSCFKVSRIP